MTSQQGQLQALITEIEALLGRATPRLPWMMPGEAGEQRRVMEQALAYLREVQETAARSPGWGLVANAGAIAPTTDRPTDLTEGETPAPTEAASQQVLQALLQEMQYLRAQMVQPLTSEVIALQQQRETLKNEVRQLEQERLQRAATPAESPNPIWVSEVVEQLRSSLLEQLTPQLKALQGQLSDYPALSGATAPEALPAAADFPQLTPQQRLEQLRQIQAQTDAMLLRLDGNLRAVFESLDQSIQSYCDTLNHGLDAMHGLGQQGEFIFRTFINHLAEQLQEEAANVSTRLTQRQNVARLQGDARGWSAGEAEDTASRDELMEAIADFDDVDLNDLDNLDLDADLDVDEEITLFQLDEEFEDLPLEDDLDEDEVAADEMAFDDAGEPTIVQTEPVAWEVATGQVADPSEPEDMGSIDDDEPTVAYTEEIDALYASIFGSSEAIAESPEASATRDEAAEAVDQSLLNLDAAEASSEPVAADPAAATVSPTPENLGSPSLDLDFLLEADTPESGAEATSTAPFADTVSALDGLMGAEVAAELAPVPAMGAEGNDTIASLTELLPEAEQQHGSRQVDPFAVFDESEDMFIPAPPDENLLDVESEGPPPQVELTLDDETLNQLTSDLSRLEHEDTPIVAPGPAEPIAPEPVAPTLEPSAESLEEGDAAIAESADEDSTLPESEPEAAGVLPSLAETDAEIGVNALTSETVEPRAAIDFDEDLSSSAGVTEAPADLLEDDIPQDFADLFGEPTADGEDGDLDLNLELTQDTDAAEDLDSGLAESEDWDLPQVEEADDFQESTALMPDLEPSDRPPTPDEKVEPQGFSGSPEAASNAAMRPPMSRADLAIDEAAAARDIADFFGEASLESATVQPDPENLSLDNLLADIDADSSPIEMDAPVDEAAEPTALDEEISLETAFADDATAPDLSLETADPEELTLGDVFGTEAIAPDLPQETASPESIDENLTLEDAFGDETAAPEAAAPAAPPEESFTLEEVFGDEAIVPDLPQETASPESIDENLTLEDAFGDEVEAPGTTFPESTPEESFTLEEAFGDEAIAPDLGPETAFPESIDENLTLDDAFGEATPDAAPDESFTLDNAFGATPGTGAGQPADSSAATKSLTSDDEPLTLETLEDWSDAEATVPGPPDEEPGLTAESWFDPTADAAEDWSITLDDISLELELPNLPSDRLSFAPEIDSGDRPSDANLSDITLETDLFPGAAPAPDASPAGESESVTPDDLVEQLDSAALPDDIPPVSDELSLENWGASLDAAPAPSEMPESSLEALSFGDLDLNLSLDIDALEAEPEAAEAADASPEMAAADLFSELDDVVLPTLDEGSAEAAGTPPAPTNPLDSSLDTPPPPAAEPPAAALDRPLPDSEVSEPSGAAERQEPTSAFGLQRTGDDSVRLTSDVASAALERSLADIPDAAAVPTDRATPATAETDPVPTEPATANPESAPSSPDLTVSGSAAEGFHLQVDPAPGVEAVDRALNSAPPLAELAEEPAIAATDLQQQMGQRVLSLADMVAATSLPFSAAVSLSELPDVDAPIAFMGGQDAEAIAADRALPDVPGLPLQGSIADGFAVAFPEADRAPLESLSAALPTPAGAEPTDDLAAAIAPPPTEPLSAPTDDPSTATADPDRELADSVLLDTEEMPLTDDELAALFPPDALPTPGDLEAEATDDLLTETTDQAFADLFPPITDAAPDESAPAPTETAPASPPTPDEDDPLAASTTLDLETSAATIDADSLDWDPMDADFPLEETAATSSLEDDLDATFEGMPSLADIDLSMEEISESEIESDEVFRSAFEDLTPDVETSEEEADALDAAITEAPSSQPEPDLEPAAREGDPSESPATPTDDAVALAADGGADQGVFASSGMLATLGQDEPDAADPEAEDDTELAAEWFLGIDFGTSGLSAVLMEHYSGSAHPLCWVADAPADSAAANFRLPAIATFQSGETLAADAVELAAVGPAATAAANTAHQAMLHSLRPLLRVGMPHETAEGYPEPVLQWSATQTVTLETVMAAVRALLRLLRQPDEAGLQLEAIGLETSDLDAVLDNLQGVVLGIPTNWSDTYCFNLREAVLATGLVAAPGQIFFVEEAIAAILSGLPDPNEPPPDANRQVQTLYQCHWQGGTVVISGGTACTEVGIVDLPQPLDALSREDFKLRNLAYGGDALDLDIICQLLVPPERRQQLEPGDRRTVNQGWGWQAALPEVANARWADLQIEAIDLPQLAEPDPSTRQRLRQHLRSSPLGQSLLEAARYLKLILQNQNQYQLELADQSWRVLRRDLESRVLVPYIQRINQQVNALLSQTGLASQGINQVICTGGNASFNTIAKWLRQKFPNATIIQDTYPSDRPQTCSRVAYGLVNLCRYPQVLDVPRHQYGDYFLLHEMLRIIPDAPLPFDGILHLLEEQGINTEVCQSRIAAILEGHLPPGLLPDAATRELLSRDTLMGRTYQDLAAGSLFSKQTRNIYVVNAAQRDRLRHHLEILMQGKQQTLTEPLIAQLVSV